MMASTDHTGPDKGGLGRHPRRTTIRVSTHPSPGLGLLEVLLVLLGDAKPLVAGALVVVAGALVVVARALVVVAGA
jgi:hypothetical protein